MAITKIFHTTASNDTASTTSAVDTTGCDFLLLSMVKWNDNSPNSIQDNKSNTWTALTKRGTSSNINIFSYYTVPSTTGSGHTFYASVDPGQGCGLVVVGFSGVKASSPKDGEVGTDLSSSVTSIAQGDSSITPSENNCLVASAVGITSESITSFAAAGAFTLAVYLPMVNGINYGLGVLYSVQTTAATVSGNVATWSGSSGAAVETSVFKSAAGGGSAPNRNLLLRVG